MPEKEAIEILESIGNKADYENLNEEEKEAIDAYYIAIKAIKKIEKLKSILKGDEEYDCYTKHFLMQELDL